MQPDGMEIPRLIIAALRGGSGKTLLSIGIIAALRKLDNTIAPFKKGPDYIDAGWLALAADRPCYNLDSFLLSQEDNLHSFLYHSANRSLSVIEGNRGLFDGIDLAGSTSTAELAKLLHCPVVLCVDCTKITRTMAAVVMGCSLFDPDVMVKAVILNRVANLRHEKKLRDSIEHYCGIPVLGAIPKLDQQHFPERHLGLVPTPEHDWATDAIEAIANIAEQHLDLKAILKISQQAPGLKAEDGGQRTEDRSQKSEVRGQRSEVRRQKTGDRGRGAESRDLNGELGSQNSEGGIRKAETRYSRRENRSSYQVSSIEHPVSGIENPVPRIGIVRDSAFQFYYPENIDALSDEGAEVVFVSPLKDRELLDLDALYIGGGFPETHAEKLADNKSFSRQLKALADDGFPIYAECGGLMYLGEKLILEGNTYSMAGILPVAFDFYKKPQGHGYTIVTVEGENPYYDVGTEIRGHEFHYSRVSNWTGAQSDLVFRMKRGVGIHKDRDGIVYKNVLATYTHVHALGVPGWAAALIRNAVEFRNSR
ncbi:MAG: cobyrinate a,c-diamide synthase [Desulfobacteraceae bacterium]|jgi:cobyrinic acid a,c-diamide synthase|nr:cobyrinate a,c-diamide synthase [Desulfobacteraceae bacterium]